MVFAKVKVPSIPIHQRLKSKSLSLMKRSLMKLLTVVKGMGRGFAFVAGHRSN